MEELLTFIVAQITGNPPQSIDQSENEEMTTYTITVPKEYMGILIGKEGRVISAIRTLARVRAAKEGKRVNVELQEPPETVSQ